MGLIIAPTDLIWLKSKGRERKGLLLQTPEVIKAIDDLIGHRDKEGINPANQCPLALKYRGIIR